MVGMTWKPVRQFRDKRAADFQQAATSKRSDLIGRSQHRGMLLHVAVPGWEACLAHPGILRFEVLTQMVDHIVKMLHEICVGAVSGAGDDVDELGVDVVHRTVAEHDARERLDRKRRRVHVNLSAV